MVLVFGKENHNINIAISILKVAGGGDIIQIILDINNKDNTRALDWPNAREILEFASNFHKVAFWELLRTNMHENLNERNDPVKKRTGPVKICCVVCHNNPN